jgi:aminopeptidase N
MGEELFFKGLQSYFQENRFQNAGKADIIRTFNQVSGRDWQHHFDQWLYDGV